MLLFKCKKKYTETRKRKRKRNNRATNIWYDWNRCCLLWFQNKWTYTRTLFHKFIIFHAWSSSLIPLSIRFSNFISFRNDISLFSYIFFALLNRELLKSNVYWFDLKWVKSQIWRRESVQHRRYYGPYDWYIQQKHLQRIRIYLIDEILIENRLQTEIFENIVFQTVFFLSFLIVFDLAHTHTIGKNGNYLMAIWKFSGWLYVDKIAK